MSTLLNHLDLFRNVITTANSLGLSHQCPILRGSLLCDPDRLVQIQQSDSEDSPVSGSNSGAMVVPDRIALAIILDCCSEVMSFAPSRLRDSEIQLTLVALKHITQRYEHIQKLGVEALSEYVKTLPPASMGSATPYETFLKPIIREIQLNSEMGDNLLALSLPSVEVPSHAESIAFALLQSGLLFQTFNSIADYVVGNSTEQPPASSRTKTLISLGLVGYSDSEGYVLLPQGREVFYHSDKIRTVLFSKSSYTLTSAGSNLIDGVLAEAEHSGKLRSYLDFLLQPPSKLNILWMSDVYQSYGFNVRDEVLYNRTLSEDEVESVTKSLDLASVKSKRLDREALVSAIRYGLVQPNPYHSNVAPLSHLTSMVLTHRGLALLRASIGGEVAFDSYVSKFFA